ncbi:MAG TPA: electron transfer flavoprotein subunit beta/FixA family protein [Symbiobacteriaceae bacterium]|jgi:electron transfer flavoprotein beta subunit|nr:electron transfer flavoprotein subunit beta/FixA family protein [Symbiobacteriaceae bacterium]
MEILVLLKQTFDTEAKITVKDGRILDDDVTLVINPYDEYAVEEALKLREAHGGTVTVVSVGGDKVEEALRRALAMGADEAVLIEPPAEADEFAAAGILAGWARGKAFELVLAGNVSVDTGAGQTALRFAELMGIPHVAAALKLEVAGGKATVHRDAEGDTEVVEVPLPALVTAQQGLNEPRYPSVPGIMKAKRKTIARVQPESVIEALTQVTSVFQAQQNRRNTIIKGSPAEQAKQLVQLLRGEAKVV